MMTDRVSRLGGSGIPRLAALARNDTILAARARNDTIHAALARNDTMLISAPLGMTNTIEIDAYVIDTLMADLVGHDRQPSAFFVYLLLWRRTHGAGEENTQVSLLDIASATGLSKRAIQEALGWLSKRRLISVQRASITAVPVYTVKRPWRR